jgi:hypothetical protein
VLFWVLIGLLVLASLVAIIVLYATLVVSARANETVRQSMPPSSEQTALSPRGATDAEASDAARTASEASKELPPPSM